MLGLQSNIFSFLNLRAKPNNKRRKKKLFWIVQFKFWDSMKHGDATSNEEHPSYRVLW